MGYDSRRFSETHPTPAVSLATPLCGIAALKSMYRGRLKIARLRQIPYFPQRDCSEFYGTAPSPYLKLVSKMLPIDGSEAFVRVN